MLSSKGFSGRRGGDVPANKQTTATTTQTHDCAHLLETAQLRGMRGRLLLMLSVKRPQGTSEAARLTKRTNRERTTALGQLSLTARCLTISPFFVQHQVYRQRDRACLQHQRTFTTKAAGSRLILLQRSFFSKGPTALLISGTTRQVSRLQYNSRSFRRYYMPFPAADTAQREAC